MSQNLFWAIFHNVGIWLAGPQGALKPDWLNSLMLKTLLGEIPMSQNPVRAAFHFAEFWLADRYKALKPDWLNSLMVKTPLGEFPMFDNLWSDNVQNVIHLDNQFRKRRCSFDLWPRICTQIRTPRSRLPKVRPSPYHHWSPITSFQNRCSFDPDANRKKMQTIFFSYDPPYSRGNKLFENHHSWREI